MGFTFFFTFLFSNVYIMCKRSIARNLLGRDMDDGCVFIGNCIYIGMSYQVFYLYFTALSFSTLLHNTV
jgi:hypothetical protein